MSTNISNVKNSAVAVGGSTAQHKCGPPSGRGPAPRDEETKEHFDARCKLFFAATEGLAKSRSRLGMFALLGKSKVDSETVMALHSKLSVDHYELWNKDGKPYIFTSHVFMLEWEKLQKLVDFCRDNNLELEISSRLSWYHPGNTTLCIFRKPSAAPLSSTRAANKQKGTL
jgi:hypothetical protein